INILQKEKGEYRHENKPRKVADKDKQKIARRGGYILAKAGKPLRYFTLEIFGQPKAVVSPFKFAKPLPDKGPISGKIRSKFFGLFGNRRSNAQNGDRQNKKYDQVGDNYGQAARHEALDLVLLKRPADQLNQRIHQISKEDRKDNKEKKIRKGGQDL